MRVDMVELEFECDDGVLVTIGAADTLVEPAVLLAIGADVVRGECASLLNRAVMFVSDDCMVRISSLCWSCSF